MKRNPLGTVAKGGLIHNTTLKNRRGSSANELAQRLHDVKTNNCRFRKNLLEKEAELQVVFW